MTGFKHAFLCLSVLRNEVLGCMIIMLCAGTSLAQDSLARCDRYAALQADPAHTAPPVAFEMLDATSAILSCTNALEQPLSEMELGRVWLQLGRGYLKGGQSAEAMAAFKQAASHHYPAGYFALGVAYYLGDDIPSDHKRAEELLKKALEKGVIWSAKALSALYDDPSSDYYDRQLASHFDTLFAKKNL